MFKRVVTHKGFWKSVAIMTVVYAVLLFVIRWMGTNFNKEFTNLGVQSILVFLLAGFIVSFATAYGKFWAKLKEKEYKK